MGLKADPGCLLACVTLLNSLDLKLNPPTKALTSPECGSRTTIPPFTFGYCFKSQILFSPLTKIMSAMLNISKIFFLFGIAHLSFLKQYCP